ncbi:MAG: hypothetical protein ACHP8A_20000 [Terriglobales bacterium]
MFSPLFHARDNIEAYRRNWYETSAGASSAYCTEYLSLQSAARGRLDESGIYLMLPASDAEAELAAELSLFQHRAVESFFTFELSLPN